MTFLNEICLLRLDVLNKYCKLFVNRNSQTSSRVYSPLCLIAFTAWYNRLSFNPRLSVQINVLLVKNRIK